MKVEFRKTIICRVSLGWRLDVNTPVTGGCNAKARTSNYRKRNNGKWIRYFTDTEVHIGGETIDEDCNTYDVPVEKKSRRSWDISVKSNTVTCKAEEDAIEGYHKGAAGNQYFSTLGW